MVFSHKIKCDLKPPSKATCSASSQITGTSKSVMTLVRGAFSDFCIYTVYSNSAGGYAHSSCPLQSLKLIFQPFGEKLTFEITGHKQK